MSFFGLFKKNDSPIKAEILRLAKNEITMVPKPGQNPLHPDDSKIGGKPFLPADFEWPEFADKKEGIARPLSFFCQLNLAQLAPLDKDHLLPDHGMLSFFYECESFRWGFDPDDKGAAKVFYFEDTKGFVPFSIPEGIEEGYIMPELAVALQPKQSYPMYEEFTVHSDRDCDWEDYDKLLAKLGVSIEEDPEGHKVLGYADLIQSEMLSDCERTTRGLYCGDPAGYRNMTKEAAENIQEKAKEWTLLLQLGTIQTDDFEWMFGDCGMLYYYIRKEDLAQRKFDNAWFSVQCF